MARGLLLEFFCFLLLTCYLREFQASEPSGKDDAEEADGLLVITVATEETDGFKRFLRSTKKYGLKVRALGVGHKWEGGNIAHYGGGGHKVNLLKEAMEDYKDRDDLLIMFVDSYDLVATAGPDDIKKSFQKFDAKVVFSAEYTCWPDYDLAEKYPEVKKYEKRYLNSGAFIGYANVLYHLLMTRDIGNLEDDQLFYTQIFLDEPLREKFHIKLDIRGEMFQNLNWALDEVQVKFKGSKSYMYNMRTGTIPHIVHGNGPIKRHFNSLTNYLVDHWTPTSGCQFCNEDTISLQDVPEDNFPRVLLGIFIEYPTAFIEEFFDNVGQMDYPKEKIDVFIHYVDEFHTDDIQNFMDKYGTHYNSVKMHGPSSNVNQWEARNKALDHCLKVDCQYYLSLDGAAQIENPSTLQIMIERNRSVIAPMLVRPGKMWSNFWGAVSRDGFYKRSDDYVDFIQYNKKGQWNVPYISEAFLIHGSRIPELLGSFISGDRDPDMAFCEQLRDKGVFMYMDNQEFYGTLTSSENYETTHLHNDLYSIFDNKYMWEKKYLHQNYSLQLEEDFEVAQPCPDVYWFPIVSDKFCQDLIEEMEHFGQWSGGGHEDTRLQGGYENVPTVDIHTNQVGWERHWLQFLKDYVGPLNNKVFTGYFTESRAVMNFIVRYRPGEQDRLRPHHDSSTFTINIALNTPGQDYEGGGTRFLRYNCSVTESRQGWMLMHPGRLTHYHEGLPTVRGTRYIMISFVDP